MKLERTYSTAKSSMCEEDLMETKAAHTLPSYMCKYGPETYFAKLLRLGFKADGLDRAALADRTTGHTPCGCPTQVAVVLNHGHQH
jgi:hypothetical protein